jgi:hypothetical protein
LFFFSEHIQHARNGLCWTCSALFFFFLNTFNMPKMGLCWTCSAFCLTLCRRDLKSAGTMGVDL